MQHRLFPLIVLCLGLSLTFVSQEAFAQHGRGGGRGGGSYEREMSPEEARQNVEQGAILPLGQVLRQLRAQFGGNHVDARLASGSNSPIYEIRWLTADGRRIDFEIDARSGAIIRQRGG